MSQGSMVITQDSIDVSAVATLSDLTEQHARERPTHVALSFEGRETTYADFHRRSNQVANGLAGWGLRPGDHIVYLGKNSDRYFEILFGAAKSGVVLAPIGWRLAAAETAAIIDDCEARILFVAPDAVAQAREALSLVRTRPIVLTVDTAKMEYSIPYATWLAGSSSELPSTVIDPDNAVLQPYTSGTTGGPKGVMLTHTNLISKQRDAARLRMPWHLWYADDVSLVAMPVAHVGGSVWGVAGLLYGARNVVAREFNPLSVLDYIERDRISKLFMVPSALQIVVRQPRSREVDYSRLRCILYGASPMPVDLLRECMEVFGCGFCQQYGMTETAGAIVYLPPEDHDPEGNARMRSAGRPMPGVEIRIIDSDGLPLPAGVVGEVVTRSTSNMAGYWHLPEATAEALDADGWLHTGDAGFLDQDGYLFIHDRLKDMIISGAENIYPAEVENAIYGHPAVEEVAVIGVPDEKWGEAVKAIVVLKSDHEAAEDEIIAHARTKIAAYKLPKSIDFVDQLPRNASGKVLRRELRDRFWAGRERRVN